jgi:dsRNA-specific ribonuclease
MSQFQQFIVDQLKQAGVSEEHRLPIFLKSKEKFIQAFTHRSFNPQDFKNVYAINRILIPYDIKVTDSKQLSTYQHYDTMEFKGDLYLKTVHGKILADRYPLSAKMDQQRLTFAFQKLIAEDSYSAEAERMGLFQFILMSDVIQQQAIFWKEGKLEQLDPDLITKYWKKGVRVNIYKKLLEDTMESLACAIVEAVDLYTDSIFGPGMAMLYRWSLPFFDNLTFDPTDLDATKARGMVLRELWEQIYPVEFAGRKVSNEMMFTMVKIQGKPIEISAVDPITGEVIAITTGISEKEARSKASDMAVTWLYKWKDKEIEAGKEVRRKFKESQTVRPPQPSSIRPPQPSVGRPPYVPIGPPRQYIGEHDYYNNSASRQPAGRNPRGWTRPRQ